MKFRIGVLVFLTAMLLSCFTVSASEAQIQIFINGKRIESPQAPVMKNGNTLVPMRVIFEELGYTVTWDDKEKSIFAENGNPEELIEVLLRMERRKK